MAQFELNKWNHENASLYHRLESNRRLPVFSELCYWGVLKEINFSRLLRKWIGFTYDRVSVTETSSTERKCCTEHGCSNCEMYFSSFCLRRYSLTCWQFSRDLKETEIKHNSVECIRSNSKGIRWHFQNFVNESKNLIKDCYFADLFLYGFL